MAVRAPEVKNSRPFQLPMPETGARNLGESSSRYLVAVGLCGVLALAMALRGVMVPAGLPVQVRSPEEALHVGRALQIAAGDLDPHFYIYPSLHFYLMATTLKAVFGNELAVDPLGPWSPRFALASRWLSVVLGLVGILAMFAAGRALGGEELGLLAALLTAVNPIHLYATTDTCVDASLSTFFCLTLWRLIRLCQAPTIANCAWAGLCAGLATSCKQPGVALFVVILISLAAATEDAAWQPGKWRNRLLVGIGIALVLGSFTSFYLASDRKIAADLVTRIFQVAGVEEAMARERGEAATAVLLSMLKKVGILGGLGAALLLASRRPRALVARIFLSRGALTAMGVGFLALAATSPYLFIRFPQTLRALLHLAYQGTSTGWGGGFVSGAGSYFQQLLSQFGPFWLLATSFCLLASGRLRWPEELPWLGVALVVTIYFFAFASHRTPFSWYMLPASHGLELLAAGGLWFGWRLFAGSWRRDVAWSVGCALVIAWPLTSSVALALEFTAVPTQLLALNWLDENVPADAVLVRTADSTQPEVLGNKYRTINLDYAMEKMGSAYLAEQQADYLIVSERMHDLWKKGPVSYARELAGFQWVYGNLKLVRSIKSGYRMQGPEIGIYKVPEWMRRGETAPENP